MRKGIPPSRIADELENMTADAVSAAHSSKTSGAADLNHSRGLVADVVRQSVEGERRSLNDAAAVPLPQGRDLEAGPTLGQAMEAALVHLAELSARARDLERANARARGEPAAGIPAAPPRAAKSGRAI